MLFPARYWPGLEDGSVTVAFRRQKRPTVRAGGTLRSPGGVLAIDEVTPIDEADITDVDARAAGHQLGTRSSPASDPKARCSASGSIVPGTTRAGVPRTEAALDETTLAELRTKLARLDWAEPILRRIAAKPAVVSTELAADLGMERLPFKSKVRRLKELGLTESLETGYRLSPRGKRSCAQSSTISHRAPGPSSAATSSGFDNAHVFSDRHPQPMQLSSRSRNRCISSMRRSSSGRQPRDRRVQSAAVGV